MSETRDTSATRRLTVTLDRSLIGRLKAAAFTRDITMGEFVAEAVEKALDPKRIEAKKEAEVIVAAAVKDAPVVTPRAAPAEPPTPGFPSIEPTECPKRDQHILTDEDHPCTVCGYDGG